MRRSAEATLLNNDLHFSHLKDAALFEACFDDALRHHVEQIDAIADAPHKPSFDNCIRPLEASGQELSGIARQFSAVAGAATNGAIQELERRVYPRLARHFSAISMNERLFRRVEAVAEDEAQMERLSPVERRIVHRLRDRMVRAGASLPAEERERLAGIESRLSELTTAFGQNILADENEWTLPLSEDDLEGLPSWLVASLENAGAERGSEGPVLTLSRSLVVPFLEHSPRSDLRQTAFEAWTRRGEGEGAHDNRPVMAEILRLRGEKAALLGYPNYAAFKLSDQMARSADNVRDLLMRVWAPARDRAVKDAEALQALARRDGDDRPLKAADWRYYAAERRRTELAFDESALKPYLSLERVIEAAFDVANRLFGLRFKPIDGVNAWHPDVRAWTVLRADGSQQGSFLADYFARSGKRSGAWMSVLRPQHKTDGGATPIVFNVCNFSKPPKGQPALLSLDEATTLFHEFGHALHGLLSDVEFASMSGTSVSRDFVELPSQLFEHWLTVPEILERHARHVETDEPMPLEMVETLRDAQRLDAGFATLEYAASAIVDLDLHERTDADPKPLETERETLRRLGMPEAIAMRHRTPHFAHIFSGESYSAGYYSYLWSEVLDADAFEAFTEVGDPFHAETAKRLLTHVYSAGDSEDAAVLYSLFRGREPDPAALMRKRGFVEEAA